ncbi:translation elongation factor [Knoellia sp. Soil729]|nr:translation elongation factor [Knoellia sp. Soil729]
MLATAGHVDHGKSTLVRALTGRDPDRLAQEKARGMTIELGYAWTSLPNGDEVAFVDVPGHERFVGTMLAGLGPTPAVVFVVAADQGWQAQSQEHLDAVSALGIGDGVLVVTRCDLADEERRHEVAEDAARRLGERGLDVPCVGVSAVSGLGMDLLREELAGLVARLPVPAQDAPVRLWTDRSFSVSGAGTVVTGTLGSGTLQVGDTLTLLDAGVSREVVVRGLHSQDVAQQAVGPVSRVAVNLRRVDSATLSRSAVLLTPGSFAVASVVDVRLTPVRVPHRRAGGGSSTPGAGRVEGGHWDSRREDHLPDWAVLHVGSGHQHVGVRPLGGHHARLTTEHALPWRVGDRAILRDPGGRQLWSVLVTDVDPLPLRRRGAAARRAKTLEQGGAPSDVRLASRGAEHGLQLSRLGLPMPASGVLVGEWWVDPSAEREWAARLSEAVRRHHAAHPLSAGLTSAEARHALDLPGHLLPAVQGGSLPAGTAAPGPELVTHLAVLSQLAVTDGRVHDPRVREASDLGPAEAGVAAVERTLGQSPFAAPDRDLLSELGLGARELAAAARTGRLLRLADEVVLLPDGPARAMRVLSSLEQPFTLSAARQALGTTRRVAVPLLEHLDSRGWTRRVDGTLRTVRGANG